MFKFYKLIGILVAGVYVIALAAVPALSDKASPQVAMAETTVVAEAPEVVAPIAVDSADQDEPALVQVAAALNPVGN